MYFRGGYVHKITNSNGLVFLEKDWDGGALPEDLVAEAGLMGTSFSIIPSDQRARIGGYVKEGKDIHFSIDLDNHSYISEEQTTFYLTSEINNWVDAVGSSKWALEQDSRNTSLYTLSMKWDQFSRLDSFSFKFATKKLQWLEPHHFSPSSQDNGMGTKDFIFNKKRTGKDILSFDLVQGPGKNNLDEWFNFLPSGKFGYSKTNRGASFRVFAPRASKIELILYSGNLGEAFESHSMVRSTDGSWCIEIPHSCEGSRYEYSVTQVKNSDSLTEFEKHVVDPYARAMVGRRGPGLALSVNPTPNENSFIAPAVQDLIIMEAHIRDLLTHAPIELSDGERFGFKGLSKWLRSEDCYLRKLGVNAIELQPIHEFDARSKREYHWGYMSVNFFSPSSSYASNASDGSAVAEFKELVEAFHNAGLAVIIDVVYNHVGVPPHLSYLDRELYFLTDENGELTNHSGCGNDINADSGAVRKLVLDSLLVMVEDFGIDGFRFDLGELLGFDLLAEAEKELKQKNPNIILIAEPWSFRGRLPDKIAQTGYSLWSDNCREKLLNYIKEGQEAFDIIELLKGRLDKQNAYPHQSINYLGSHDDFAFIDRICTPQEWIEGRPPPRAIEQAKLAMALLFLSPGVPMLAAGQDYMHSKKGVRNTYQRGDLNALDYSQITHSKDFHEWVKSLISFRNSEDGLYIRLPSYLPESHYFCTIGPSNSFAHIIFSKAGDKDSPFLLLLVNPSNRNITLPAPTFCEGKRSTLLLGEINTKLGQVLPISLQVWKFF